MLDVFLFRPDNGDWDNWVWDFRLNQTNTAQGRSKVWWIIFTGYIEVSRRCYIPQIQSARWSVESNPWTKMVIAFQNGLEIESMPWWWMQLRRRYNDHSKYPSLCPRPCKPLYIEGKYQGNLWSDSLESKNSWGSESWYLIIDLTHLLNRSRVFSEQDWHSDLPVLNRSSGWSINVKHGQENI